MVAPAGRLFRSALLCLLAAGLAACQTSADVAGLSDEERQARAERERNIVRTLESGMPVSLDRLVKDSGIDFDTISEEEVNWRGEECAIWDERLFRVELEPINAGQYRQCNINESARDLSLWDVLIEDDGASAPSNVVRVTFKRFIELAPEHEFHAIGGSAGYLARQMAPGFFEGVSSAKMERWGGGSGVLLAYNALVPGREGLPPVPMTCHHAIGEFGQSGVKLSAVRSSKKFEVTVCNEIAGLEAVEPSLEDTWAMLERVRFGVAPASETAELLGR